MPNIAKSALQSFDFGHRVWRRLWIGIRAWCGDSDYEYYVRSSLNRGNAPTLSEKQFYVERMNQRYSRPSRCC